MLEKTAKGQSKMDTPEAMTIQNGHSRDNDNTVYKTQNETNKTKNTKHKLKQCAIRTPPKPKDEPTCSGTVSGS